MHMYLVTFMLFSNSDVSSFVDESFGIEMGEAKAASSEFIGAREVELETYEDAAAGRLMPSPYSKLSSTLLSTSAAVSSSPCGCKVDSTGRPNDPCMFRRNVQSPTQVNMTFHRHCSKTETVSKIISSAIASSPVSQKITFTTRFVTFMTFS